MEPKKSVQKKRLRSGYTTGACAAAAAKAATVLAMGIKDLSSVEIPFPDGSRVKFRIQKSEIGSQNNSARASVVKDAGDDPDVTNGAEIVAEAKIVQKPTVGGTPIGSAEDRKGKQNLTNIASKLIIRGGTGIGVVTKPGLAVPVGEAAINPVPRRMITEAVLEALIFRASELPSFRSVEITISIPDGEKLAKKTLNYRLGIVGGISILGTTGIVRPVSSEAWTATITSSMDVAKATGQHEIVLSAGRASEKAHMKKYGLPEESYVMMGDYLEFSLLEAKKHGFKKIHLCAQWAKMLKIAMATPQTHVRHGAIDVKKAIAFLVNELGIANYKLQNMEFNTAREIFDFLNSSLIPHASAPSFGPSSLLLKVCSAAQKYAEKIAGLPVSVHLVSYEGEIIAGNV